MKAAIYTRYGPPEVVEIQEVETPLPRETEILVRVRATTLCTADWRYRKADPIHVRLINGFWRPKRFRSLGMEYAGVVESVGRSVTTFRSGDEVFGATSIMTMGTHAEYVCVDANSTVAIKPAGLSFEEAASIFYGGASALYFLKKANIGSAQSVLVYGASGSVGVFAVQLAKHFSARVTGVCSTKNVDLVKSLGADAVIDYTKDDFSKNGRIYDMIYDTVGKSGYARSLRALKPNGSYVRVGGSGSLWSIVSSLVADKWTSWTSSVTCVSGIATGFRESQIVLKDLLESGEIRAVIDRRYSLDEIVAAHRYAEAGHKVGNVVITVP